MNLITLNEPSSHTNSGSENKKQKMMIAQLKFDDVIVNEHEHGIYQQSFRAHPSTELGDVSITIASAILNSFELVPFIVPSFKIQIRNYGIQISVTDYVE